MTTEIFQVLGSPGEEETQGEALEFPARTKPEPPF